MCRRPYEQSFVKSRKPNVPVLLEILEEDTESNILKVRYKTCTITNAFPDNTLLMKDKTVVEVGKISLRENKIQIEGEVCEKRNSIVTYPLDSKFLDMWKLENEPSLNIVTYEITSVEYKLVRLSDNKRAEGSNKVYVIPLLHI